MREILRSALSVYQIDLDRLREARPDVVITQDLWDVCAVSIDDARRVSARRVYVADGNAYFNRPGPRLAESLEILAACVHPDAFPEFRQRHDASVRRVTPGLSLEPFRLE